MSVRGATSCGRSLCGSEGRDREDRRGLPRRSAFAPDASSTVPTGNDRYECSANLAPNKIANSGDFTPRAARATQESDQQQDLYGGGSRAVGHRGRAGRSALALSDSSGKSRTETGSRPVPNGHYTSGRRQPRLRAGSWEASSKAFGSPPGPARVARIPGETNDAQSVLEMIRTGLEGGSPSDTVGEPSSRDPVCGAWSRSTSSPPEGHVP